MALQAPLTDQLGLADIGCIDPRRERNSLGINTNLGFRAFALPGETNAFATAFGGREGRVNEALFHVETTGLDELASHGGHDFPECLVFDPEHQVVMDRGLWREGLWKIFPLDARVQDEENRLKDLPRIRTWPPLPPFFGITR